MASSSPTSGGDHPLGQLELGVFVRGEEEAAAVEAVDAVQQHAAVERRRELTCDAPLEDSGSSFSELEAKRRAVPTSTACCAVPAEDIGEATPQRGRPPGRLRLHGSVAGEPQGRAPATAESGCAL